MSLSFPHEAIVDLVRDRPAWVVDLVRPILALAKTRPPVAPWRFLAGR